MCDLVACSSDVARCSWTLAATSYLPGCRSPRSGLEIEVHAPDWIPSRVPHVLPADRSLTGADFPEVPRPFDDVTRASPTCAGPSGSSTVPLPGSLSLSAVSWQARARDPLGSLPPVGSSPPEPSPRGDRAPLSRPLAPLQSVTDLRRARCARRSPPVSPTPASLLLSRGLAPQSPGSPVGYGLPFHAARARPFGRSPPRFPVAPGPRTGIARPPVSSTCFEALIPPSSPFTRRSVSRSCAVAALLGFAPLELSSDQAPDPT